MTDFRQKVEFEAKCIKKTASAILVDIDGTEYFIPDSQVDDDSEVFDEGDEGKLVVSEWIAKEKGLI